jgi:hypothetical protein
MIMDKLFSSFNTMIICKAIENVAMTAGIVYAACYFERWTILWFLFLPALNGLTLQRRREE